MTADDIAKKLRVALDHVLFTENIDEIIIEKQFNKSSKILGVSWLVHAWATFILAPQCPRLKKSSFYKAMNKGLIYSRGDGPFITCTLKDKVKRRKFLAIKHTEYLLPRIVVNQEKWKPFFDQLPSKQDDLADAFLQGLSWLTKLKHK